MTMKPTIPQAAPRSLHDLIEQGAKLTSCTACGAGPGTWCLCEAHGIHLSRFARARASGLITAAEFASVIADADVFTGSTVVLDGEAARYAAAVDATASAAAHQGMDGAR